ncbi:DUF4166 domain-containing protein [Melittangium boletus]|uniref:DUF4166 domain-containing protein n=1 Tax=Melittangium boletus DSM 14713 TaxID=1294270 RepID=A0A250I8Z6_9BACT|nr:DUF4166 domain-containing protein [Melittangium boletus]ATB28339.1 hypothetical protein MEBOL_001785 [Melittangium boletus DSM 14713]
MRAPETSLYARLLGADWERLPELVRRMHVEGRARGHFTIRRGPGLLAALVGWLCRFPPAGEDIPTRLVVQREGEGQRWERAFGPHALATRQHVWPGQRLVEWLGPVACVFHLRPEGPGLRYEQVGAWLRLGPWNLPLPRLLSPRIEAWVTAESPEGMRVQVRIGAALVGALLSYEGRISPEEAP